MVYRFQPDLWTRKLGPKYEDGWFVKKKTSPNNYLLYKILPKKGKVERVVHLSWLKPVRTAMKRWLPSNAPVPDKELSKAATDERLRNAERWKKLNKRKEKGAEL